MGPPIDPQNLPERGTLIARQDQNNGTYTGEAKKNAHTGIFEAYVPPVETPTTRSGGRIKIIDQMHFGYGGQRGPDHNHYSFIPGQWHIVLTESPLDASHDNDPTPTKSKK